VPQSHCSHARTNKLPLELLLCQFVSYEAEGCSTASGLYSRETPSSEVTHACSMSVSVALWPFGHRHRFRHAVATVDTWFDAPRWWNWTLIVLIPRKGDYFEHSLCHLMSSLRSHALCLKIKSVIVFSILLLRWKTPTPLSVHPRHPQHQCMCPWGVDRETGPGIFRPDWHHFFTQVGLFQGSGSLAEHQVASIPVWPLFDQFVPACQSWVFHWVQVCTLAVSHQ